MATKKKPLRLNTQKKYGANRGVVPVVKTMNMVIKRHISAAIFKIFSGIAIAINDGSFEQLQKFYLTYLILM